MRSTWSNATRRTAVVACTISSLLALGLGTAVAQYGHPLKGSWSGHWEPDPETRRRLLVVFDWDGERLTGTINPGPDAVIIERASLDSATWTIHLEARGRSANGTFVSYAIDGELTNIGSAHRVITGSWTQGSVTGNFAITRN